MKLALELVASALVATLASAADIPTCQVSQLKVLTENTDLPLCISKAGVVFSTLSTTPTDAQLAKMCSTTECVKLLEAILSVNPADCKVPTSGAIALRSQLVDPAVAYCAKTGVQVKASSNANSSNSSDAGTVKAADTATSSTPAATTAPTTAPPSGAVAHALASSITVFVIVVASLL